MFEIRPKPKGIVFSELASVSNSPHALLPLAVLSAVLEVSAHHILRQQEVVFHQSLGRVAPPAGWLAGRELSLSLNVCC